MNSKKIHTLYIVLFLVTNFGLLHAQTLEESMAMAQTMQPGEASYKLLKRCYYFADENTKKNLLEPLAISAFYAQQYSESVQLFTTLKKTSPIKTENEMMRLAGILNQNQWDLVQAETDSMEYFETDTTLIKNGLFFRLLAQIQLNDKENAIKTAKVLEHYTQITHPIAFDSLKLAYEKDIFPNSKKAKNLSLLLPGLGQWYAKDKRNALNALALNGTLITCMVVTANFYSWPSSLLFWVYYVPHYYLGNARAAKDIAIEKAEQKRWHYFQAFKTLAQ